MISARRPDLVYSDKEKKQTYLIDIACGMDRNEIDKEKEMIDKCLNLMIELQYLWDTIIDIVPIFLVHLDLFQMLLTLI